MFSPLAVVPPALLHGLAMLGATELRNFRAVVGEQARDRVMDETIAAILEPTATKSSPWDGYRRPPQLLRVQGNSKYVARRSVSTEPVHTMSVRLAPLAELDSSLRGPGTPGKPTPRMTLMANKLEQVQGGLQPLRSSEDLDHYHRFNKSLNSRQLRRGGSKTPTVQMEYIVNVRPPVHAEKTSAVDFAINAFRRSFLRNASGLVFTSFANCGQCAFPLQTVCGSVPQIT